MLQSAFVGLFQSGGAYAVLAVCVILMYRTTGVLNFALAAVGRLEPTVLLPLYKRDEPGRGGGMRHPRRRGHLCPLRAHVHPLVLRCHAYLPGGIAIALLVGTAAVTIRVFSDQPREIPAVIPGSGFSVAGVVLTPTSIAG